jgi:hypothetical protein
MNYNVLIEGQTIPVPEEIGVTDEMIKRALTPYYPEVANAMMTRVAIDDTTTITVVKRAGTKGSHQVQGLQSLIDCAGGRNPTIVLYEEIQSMELQDPVKLLELDARIEQVMDQGCKLGRAVEYAADRLKATSPQPAPMIILGF